MIGNTKSLVPFSARHAQELTCCDGRCGDVASGGFHDAPVIGAFAGIVVLDDFVEDIVEHVAGCADTFAATVAAGGAAALADFGADFEEVGVKEFASGVPLGEDLADFGVGDGEGFGKKGPGFADGGENAGFDAVVEHLDLSGLVLWAVVDVGYGFLLGFVRTFT